MLYSLLNSLTSHRLPNVLELILEHFLFSVDLSYVNIWWCVNILKNVPLK